jgi:hypothetical protein
MKKKATICLTDRDLKILRFVSKHRTVWFEVLHKKFFHGKHIDALKSTLRRLRGPHLEPRFLKSTRLPDGKVYYQLTYEGTRRVGCSRAHARPLGLQARAGRFAVQWFLFVDGAGERKPVHRDKLGIDLPRTVFIQSPFFLEGTSQFGFILLDYADDIRRISHKTAKQLETVLRNHWFDDYMSGRAFVVVILTISFAKKREIEIRLPYWLRQKLEAHLHDYRLGIGPGQNIQLKVVVVPGLSTLVPSRKERQ